MTIYVDISTNKLIGKVQQSDFGDIVNKWFGIMAKGFDATQHPEAVTSKILFVW